MLLLTVCGSVVACSNSTHNADISANDFEVFIYSDKQNYSYLEPKQIWGTFMFVGSAGEVLIHHSDPLIGFSIEGDEGFIAGSVVNDIRLETVLRQNERHSFEYPIYPASSLDSQWPDEWLENFPDNWLDEIPLEYAEMSFFDAIRIEHKKELEQLPRGEYTVRIQIIFTVPSNSSQKDFKLERELTFTVE